MDKLVYGKGFLLGFGGFEVNKNIIWGKEILVLKIYYLLNYGSESSFF